MGAPKPWFRYYVEALDDPKVQLLSPDLFKAWVNLLCVAAKNEGKIASLSDAAYGLRKSEDGTNSIVLKLAAAGLLDRVEGGYYEPHKWEKRQYKNDHSTDRVRKHRANKSDCADSRQQMADETVSGNGVKRFPGTDQSRAEQSRTEIDDDGGAGRAGPARKSTAAYALAKTVAVIAGRTDEFERTGWGGAAQRVQLWLEKGWDEQSILSSVREQVGRTRTTPNSISYFEKGIAVQVARMNEPLPTENYSSKTQVYRGSKNSGGVIAAADQLIEHVRQIAEPPAICGGESAAHVRIVSQRRGE